MSARPPVSHQRRFGDVDGSTHIRSCPCLVIRRGLATSMTITYLMGKWRLVKVCALQRKILEETTARYRSRIAPTRFDCPHSHGLSCAGTADLYPWADQIGCLGHLSLNRRKKRSMSTHSFRSAGKVKRMKMMKR